MNQKNIPKVCVLLATFNGAKWLESQIDSVITQRNVCVDILIRDDGSTDNTLVVINKLLQKYKNIFLMPSSAASGSASANFFELIRGCELERYDYFAFCDQDDIWYSDKLSRATYFIEKSNSDGYSSSVEAVWSNGKRATLNQSSAITTADFLFEGAGQGCTFVLPANVFERVQRFACENKILINKFHYHDWFVYILIRSWGGVWFFDPKPSMTYRQHCGNDTGARGTLSSVLLRLKKIKIGWYKEQIAMAIEISLKANFNKSIKNFLTIFDCHNSISRRFGISKFILINGRRRLSDRFILMISVLIGYI